MYLYKKINDPIIIKNSKFFLMNDDNEGVLNMENDEANVDNEENNGNNLEMSEKIVIRSYWIMIRLK